MVTVLPLAFFSDRLGSRRKFLLGAASLSAAGISLLSFINGGTVWVAAMMTGCVRDGFMAISLRLINEIPGVKNKYSGMATGFMMSFMGLGNLLAPPVGNSLANGTMAGVPLIFWLLDPFRWIMCFLRFSAETCSNGPEKYRYGRFLSNNLPG